MAATAAAESVAAAGGAAMKKLARPGALFSRVRQCGGIRMSMAHPPFSSSSASSASPASPPSPASPLPPASPPGHGYNPPDAKNPDSGTLQEQWRYATRMYSKWYANAWGTAILAGLSFYGLGWYIKGENPLRFGSSEEKEEATLQAE